MVMIVTAKLLLAAGCTELVMIMLMRMSKWSKLQVRLIDVT